MGEASAEGCSFNVIPKKKKWLEEEEGGGGGDRAMSVMMIQFRRG